jgi:hypothetical protein
MKRWFMGIILIYFSLISFSKLYASEDPPQEVETRSCAVLKLELKSLHNTDQWDFFTSQKNEFFFDVLTDQASSYGNGSTSQILTPEPVQKYYSDPVSGEGNYDLVALLPIADAKKVFIVWRENDTMTGVIDRSSADIVATGSMKLEELQWTDNSFTKILNGSGSKPPIAVFKFTCIEADLHANALRYFSEFTQEAENRLGLGSERIRVKFKEDVPEEDPAEDETEAHMPNDEVLRLSLQESLDLNLMSAGLGLKINLLGHIDAIQLSGEVTVQDQLNVLDEMKTIETLLEPQKDQKEVGDDDPSQLPELSEEERLRLRESLRSLNEIFLSNVVSLDLWIWGDVSSLLPEDYQGFNVGPFVVRVRHETQLNNVGVSIFRDNSVTIGFPGEFVPLIHHFVTKKLSEITFGSTFIEDYQRVQDIFNHLTYLNVLSNRQGFSFFMNPIPDALHIYAYEKGQMQPFWTLFSPKWVVLGTQALSENKDSISRLIEAELALRFFFRLTHADQSDLDPAEIVKAYIGSIQTRFDKLPRNIDLEGGD